MNEYWTAVFLILTWLNLLGGTAAAVWLGVGAFMQGDRRMWIGSCMCTIIAVMSLAQLMVNQ